MRYDDSAYREVFPKKEVVPAPVIETPIETFMPSITEEKLAGDDVSVNRKEQEIEQPSVNQTDEPKNID